MSRIKSVRSVIDPRGAMTLKGVLVAGVFFVIIYQLLLFFPIRFFERVEAAIPVVEGLGIIYFLRMNNDGKRYLSLLSLVVFSFYALWFFSYYFSDIESYFGLPCLLILIVYTLRFFCKKNKTSLDYSKYILVVLFVLGNSSGILLGNHNPDSVKYYFIFLNGIFLSVGYFFYVVESLLLILNKNSVLKQRMKKIGIVFLILQPLLSISFLIFSIVQKIEADNQRALAVRNEMIANGQTQHAIMQAKIAERQRKILEERVKTLEDSLKVLKAFKK